jgi:hypothetical protein
MNDRFTSSDRSGGVEPDRPRLDRHSSLKWTACAALLAFMLPGCGPTKEKSVLPEAWATGPSERTQFDLGPTDRTSCYSRADNLIRLAGAVNETVAFEYILTTRSAPAEGVEISVEDWTGPAGVIGKDSVRIYRHWPIVVERYPNWYLRSVGLRQRREIPDALIPIEARHYGQPFNIPPTNSLPLWVEVRIPQAVQPGLYQTAMIVRSAGGGVSRTAVELTVRDIYLAIEDAIPILARVQLGPLLSAQTQLDPENVKLAVASPQGEAAIRRTFAILHEHGLSPYTDDVKPRVQQTIDGTLELDWSQYDSFCEPLIDGGAFDDHRPVEAWPVPADLKQPDPAYYGGLHSAIYAATLKDYLKASATHFDEKGWLGRAFVQFGALDRLAPTADEQALARQLAIITHLADPRLPFVSTRIPQSMVPFGWFDHPYEDLSGVVDVWATPARYQHGPTLERQRILGKRTWLQPDRPPFSGSLCVEAPLIHPRSLPWQAFLQDHDAIVLPYATDWPDGVFEEPIAKATQRSDTWLVYPGRLFGLDEPIPSVRLKQLQLGRQDYQYLRLLEKYGRGETARLLAGSLIKACGTDCYGDNYQDGLFGRRVETAATWALARAILEQELQDTLSEEPGKGLDRVANQAAWAQFLSEARGIEVCSESARVSPDDRATRPGYLIRFDMVVRSELRTPLEGRLSLGAMPADMRSVSDIVRVGPLAEMALARKQLIAETPQLPPCDVDGHYRQEVVFDGGVAGRVSNIATVSLVSAPTVAGPIVVDGDLGDWPPNEMNACGDFRLLNGRRDGTIEGAVAQSQTVAFICQSGGTLYIGIHAAVPEAEAVNEESPRYSNVVEYEDLMPIGADLVEILIDPTNEGTQSGDLFHIVLKATGGSIFERGVGTTPAIGRCEPWPGRLPEYCVAPKKGGWTAEIAIPIAVFGPQAAGNPIWGFNIARLEPHRGEYSDWAGAPRYCYDPRSLGNLVWPK